ARLPIPYLGCYIDSGYEPALPDYHAESPALTAAKCHSHCQSYGSTYSGVSHGNKCSCSDRPPYSQPAPEHECSLPCTGDASTSCGGKNRIHVWGAPLPVRERVGPYKYQGCFTDSRDDKSLTGKVTRDSEMTLEKCSSECKEYAFFGVEYGTQCFCGTELEVSARRKPQYECAMRCGGNPNEICGDGDRLSVYGNGATTPVKSPEQAGGFKFAGCWSDSVAARSLYGEVLRDGEMTVEMCARFCKGSKYMGLEYGSQCFCGDHLGGHAVGKDECSYLCEGNKKEFCGGSARLSLYEA
ncbi:WSC domain-containing protein, partial [Cercophora newfieldiana]